MMMRMRTRKDKDKEKDKDKDKDKDKEEEEEEDVLYSWEQMHLKQQNIFSYPKFGLFMQTFDGTPWWKTKIRMKRI